MTADKHLRELIAREVEAAGFAAWGIARADAAPLSGARLREWLGQGMHGDMIWMEERAHHRTSPADLWPEVRSVIALGMSYAPGAIRWRWRMRRGSGGFRFMRRAATITTRSRRR